MVAEVDRPEAEQSHTRAVEDYLKAICLLQRETGSVQTSALAQRLRRTPASVTNMVKGLAEQALVEHVPYYGVRLTEAGERAALRVIRRHRLIELYLIRHLGYSWDRVHAEAERLEHAASDELVERISAVLGHPEIDPHGSPIPGPGGEWRERGYPALSDLLPGRKGVVREVSDADPERLRYLADLGLYPSTPVTVLSRAPFEGPLRVLVGGKEKLVGRALAAMVRVEPTDEE